MGQRDGSVYTFWPRRAVVRSRPIASFHPLAPRLRISLGEARGLKPIATVTTTTHRSGYSAGAVSFLAKRILGNDLRSPTRYRTIGGAGLECIWAD